MGRLRGPRFVVGVEEEHLAPVRDLVVRGAEPSDHQRVVVAWDRTACGGRRDTLAGIALVALPVLCARDGSRDAKNRKQRREARE